MKEQKDKLPNDKASLYKLVEKLQRQIVNSHKREKNLKARNRELIQKENMLNNLLNSISEAIYFKDLKSKFIMTSKYLADKIGVNNPQELLGKTDFDFFSEKHAQNAFSCEQDIIKTGKPVSGIEEVEVWPDNQKTYVLTSKAPLFDEKGKIVGTLGTSKDITRQKELEFELQRLAHQDGLTGLANRRVFDQTIELEWRRAMRSRSWISEIMLDIDYFKAYNDHFGHLAGDECLRKVADILKKRSSRPGDFVARYGGEEFIIILADTKPDGAVVVADDIRKQVEQLKIPHKSSSVSKYVTISCGVSGIVPAQDQKPEILLLKADKALYQAKHSGRNRVNMY